MSSLFHHLVIDIRDHNITLFQQIDTTRISKNNHTLDVFFIWFNYLSIVKRQRSFARIDVMSSLIKDRDVFTKMRTTLKKFSIKSRKEHIIRKINNFLRDKLIDEIDAFMSLFLLQRVSVLLSTLTMKRQMTITLKKINDRLNNIEWNTTKIIIILTTYVAIAKTNIQREIDATTIIIASYNNINQRRQLKKTTREKTVIFKIRKQREKNNLRTLFVRKLMKKLQRAEKMKKNVMIARRLFNENVKLMIRSEKIKNKLTINNSLLKHVTSSTYAVFRIFDVLTHDVRVVDVQTKNQ